MILTINAGSSSIRFALFEQCDLPVKILRGQISRIDQTGTEFKLEDLSVSKIETLPLVKGNYASAISFLIKQLEKRLSTYPLAAIGHRVVHGMQLTVPTMITDSVIDQLKEITPFDPDHLPNEIKLIEAFRKQYPKSVQLACFDTDFHKDMPRVAQLLAIPRRFEKQGIHRYGFHGLSYQFLLQQLEKSGNAKGRVILCHLGSGASLSAIENGKCVDTSMGFTPNSGLPMSSRAGDLDPGVAWYMIKSENLSQSRFNELISHESGLLGISETSGDMNDLLNQEATDIRSAEAIGLFCYQVKKWIGAFSAVLGGLDTLVFSGGIGENSPVIRARICDGLDYLGINIHEYSNCINAGTISTGQVSVLVMPTDEEQMIAEIVNSSIVNEITV